MDLAQATWIKASRSQGGGTECVEVTRDLPGAIGVRDSKNPAGGVHVVPRTAWRALITAIKDNRM